MREDEHRRTPKPSADDSRDGAEEAVDAPAADMSDDAEMGDAETAGRAVAAAQPRRTSRADPTTSRSPPRFDETVGAEDLCEPEELDRLRGYPRQAALATCRAWWRGSPTGCSAA